MPALHCIVLPKPLRNERKWIRFVNNSIKGSQEKPFGRKLIQDVADAIKGKPRDEFRWSEIEALSHPDMSEKTHARRLRNLIQSILMQTTLSSASIKQLNPKQRAVVKHMLRTRMENNFAEQSQRLRKRAVDILGTEKYTEVVATIDALIKVLVLSRKKK